MSLPDTWAEARLTDVCELNPKLRTQARLDEDVPVTFVPMSAVNEAMGVIDKPEIRKFGEVAKGYSSFVERDVLFAKVTPCMENGKAAVVGQLKNDLGFGSTEFHVLRPTQAVQPEYVFNFVRQKAFRDRAASAFVGTGGLQRVPPDFLKRVKLPLPTLPEQQRIVDVLRQVEAVVKLKKSLSDQLERLVKTAYWEQFGAWFTADGLVDAVRISDCVADSQYGVSEAMEGQGTHAVLRMNSITTSGWLDLSDLKFANLSKKDIEATQLLDGDLLFNRTNSKELVGKCAIWRPVDGAFSFASYLVRLRLKSNMLPEYLWATLNSAYGRYRLTNAAKQAVSMANVSPTDLGRITVPLPPIELQEKFAKLVRAIEAMRSQMLAKLDAFAELQAVVGQQALTGDLTAAWRQEHAAELDLAAIERDTVPRKSGATAPAADAPVAELPAQPVRPEQTSRRWLHGELSEFQSRLLEVFTLYCQESRNPLCVEDPDVFDRFCNDSAVVEQLQAFGPSQGNRIRRALSQLAALGLIAKITLPNEDPTTQKWDYLKAFRPLRAEEFSRMADLRALRAEIDSSVKDERFIFSVHLDYATAERAGAASMFQVVSIEDDDGKDFTHLVDQGVLYASLDELKGDVAAALRVTAWQVDLEET